jgi:hypothetical protein
MYQRRLCFYTREEMTIGYGAGNTPTTASIDRVNPAEGYEVGNVVLCRNRVNTIKSDVTPDELEVWMTGWHERVVRDLPELVRQVKPIEDGRLRGVDGRRLPAWVIERRMRIDTFLEERNNK